MAEMLIKIGESGGYQDGDVLVAIPNVHIQASHAELVASPVYEGHNTDGLRHPDRLARNWSDIVYEYRFERVSRREVKRVTLGANGEALSEVPVLGVEMDVEAFLSQARRHPRHRIFGVNGSEFWYGGKYHVTDQHMQNVWNAIESRSLHRRVGRCTCGASHELWHWGTEEARRHLPARVEMLRPEDVRDLMAPLERVRPNGRPEKLGRRRRHVEWSRVVAPKMRRSAAEIRNPLLAIATEVVGWGGRFRHWESLEHEPLTLSDIATR
jgi:hypothetical protein